MFWTICRMMWVIWVTIVCMQYCSMTHIPVAYGQEFLGDQGQGYEIAPIKKAPAKISSIEYVVQAGDTLGSIATKYGTTWEKLWDINRDRIADPNLIHIGQKIRIRGAEIVVPPKPQLTREQKIDKLARFMFKKAGLEYATKKALEEGIREHQDSISGCRVTLFDNQRQLMVMLSMKTRQYEIWLLSEAIVDQTKNEDEFFKLVGLVWQETQFVNRRGRHGEVSFYQFLPSTLKWWHNTDDIGKVSVMFEVENNPTKATALALEMLRKCKWNWNWWNHNINYEYQLNNKIYSFKSEWRK
jgi:LysM repeat protein